MERKVPIIDPAWAYLTAVEASHRSPNFWMSIDYIHLKGWEWVERDGMLGFGEEPGLWALPPMDGLWLLCEDEGPVWASFPVDESLWVPGGEFLDHEFIYDPANFYSLDGGDWKVFRRNVRKWSARHPGHGVYRRLGRDECVSEAANLVSSWAGSDDVYDPETLVRFAIEGRFRWGMFYNGELIGLNVADLNWAFVNYRLCIDRGDPFLQEMLRHRFYCSSWVRTCRRLVNDGGSLGREGLERFKRKLNPAQVRRVYSLG